MYMLISVLIIIACLLLVLIVLVQNSKGGGLAANFASSNQVMGVRKTADFLEKATWTLAGTLLALSLLGTLTLPHNREEAARSAVEGHIQRAQEPMAVPTFPSEAEQPLPEQEPQ